MANTNSKSLWNTHQTAILIRLDLVCVMLHIVYRNKTREYIYREATPIVRGRRQLKHFCCVTVFRVFWRNLSRMWMWIRFCAEAMSFSIHYQMTNGINLPTHLSHDMWFNCTLHSGSWASCIFNFRMYYILYRFSGQLCSISELWLFLHRTNQIIKLSLFEHVT